MKQTITFRRNILFKALFFLSLLIASFSSRAQLVGTYTFSTATNITRDTMSAPTVALIGSNNDDSVSALTSFASITGGSGFTFLFNGITYTSFSVSSNGLLRLGALISADATNSLATATNNPKIAPYWDDLHTGTIAGGGKVHCKMIGTSPSRKLVIEWFVTVPKSASSAAAAKFQVWLSESTHATTPNVIQFIYGSGLITNSGNYTVGIGNSATSGDFWSVTTSSNTASSSTANNSNTGVIAYGRSYTFTPPAKPNCAINTSPANLTSGAPITQTISWAANGTGGTPSGYDVYFGTNSTPPLVVTNQAGTTYNPGTLVNNTTYYWQIIPRNAGGSSSGCSISQFTTIVALPVCAANFSPASAATGVNIASILSWTAGSGGGTPSGYDVYFGTAASPPLVSTNQVGSSYNPGTLLPGTLYYWRVVPRNAAGLASGCTTVLQFTTLALPVCATGFSPASSATGVPITTSLSWTAGSGGGAVSGYDVYFGTASTPPLVSINQAGLSYSPATLSPGTNYYWYVVPKNSSGSAVGCTTVMQFTTLAIPLCATSLAPANQSVNVPITSNISWAANGTGGAPSGYDVYFGTAASPPLVSPNQAGTSYTPGTMLAGTVYFWKVVPKNSSGTASGCSVSSFTTLALPSCADNLSPINNLNVVPINPTLTWTAGNTGGPPSGYDVYFGTAASPPIVSTNQPGASYTPATLLNNTTYFWKVVPRNSTGLASGCSILQFKTITTGLNCAANLSPAFGATNVLENSTLSWGAAGGTAPTGYDVYFSTNSTLVNNLDVSVRVVNNQNVTTYNPGLLAMGATYYWKVIPRTGGGPASGCLLYSFTTMQPVSYDVTRVVNDNTYTEIGTTGNKVPSWRNFIETNDNLSNSVPIGFNFSYQGINKANVRISTNGFITFDTTNAATGGGAGAYSPSNPNFFATGANGTTLAVAPFFDDLTCQGNQFTQASLDSTIKYLTTGTAPNRVFIVEWRAMEQDQNPGPDLNFQVKLYETSNIIEFVYDKMNGFDGTKNSFWSYTIGLNGQLISSPIQSGEVFAQQINNTRSFGTTLASNLHGVPDCHSKLIFTPGTYTPYVPGPAVANDEAAGAIVLPSLGIVPLDLCGTYYSSAGATASPQPACIGNPTADVWFKFTATNPVTTIKVRGAGGFDPALQLLDASLNNIACVNSSGSGFTETINATTLTNSATYYIRTYNATGGSGTDGYFSVTVNATPPPPSNDNCAGAIYLSHADTTGVNTLGATPSPNPVCTGIADDDVWYQFMAFSPNDTVIVKGLPHFDPVIQVFSGTCNSLTSISCTNITGNGATEIGLLSGLTVRSVYYIRVYDAGIGAGNGDYRIRVTAPPPPCPVPVTPTPNQVNVPITGITLSWQSSLGALSYTVYMDTVFPPVNMLAANITDTSIFSGPLSTTVGEIYYWTVIGNNEGGSSQSCKINIFSMPQPDVSLNIKVFLEGFYLPGTGGTMQPVLDPLNLPLVADNITVTFGDMFPPYEYLYSSDAVLGTDGYANCIFPGYYLGSSYYIIVNHRNTLETWTKIPFDFLTSDTLFDFTGPDPLGPRPAATAPPVPVTSRQMRMQHSSANANRTAESPLPTMIHREIELLDLINNNEMMMMDHPGNRPDLSGNQENLLMYILMSMP